MYKVFYCRYDIDFSEETPFEIAEPEILPLADKVLMHPDDFFGLEDAAETTLQFMVQADGIWVEIPDPDQGGSHGKVISREEAFEMLANLPATFSLDLLPGAAFEGW